jgi:hypothetical protein
MRSRSLLIGAVIALTATLIGALDGAGDHYYRPATNHGEGGFGGKDLALPHLVSGTRAFIAPAT